MPQKATSIRIRKKVGSERTTSTKRMRALSTCRRSSRRARPTGTPITTMIMTAAKPMKSDVWRPFMSRGKMFCPMSS